MKTGAGESQNVCFKSELSKILASSSNDRQRLDDLHNRILGLEISEQNGKGIRVIRQREPLVKSILEDSPINENVESFLNSSLPRRAAPSIPSDVRDRLYGTPGNNIFTYDIDKPKPHKSAPVHLEDGMIPTDDSTDEWYHIRRLHTLLKDSLDQSFIPKETGEPRISKKILNTAHISQLEGGLISKETVDIYGEFVNPETRGNMGANLVPLTNGRVSRRKQFKFQPQDFERSRDASESDTDSQSTTTDE